MLTDLVAEKIPIAFGAGAALAAIAPLAGDASSRRYYRARLAGPAAPPSIVVMELSGSALPLSSEELAVFSEPPTELPFLNVHRFLQAIGARVPALYGHWVQEGLLFLEDLGDTCLWERVQGLPAAEILQWYEKAIDQLLLIQVEGTRRKGDGACVAFRQRFDFRLYMWEFDHFIEYGLEKRPGVDLPAAEKERLRDAFAAIARRLESAPPCLNHRDFHSWNLMVHEGGIAVIDFQDALLAPPQYDLASLLNDRETDSAIRPDLERRLLDYYLRRREEMGERRVDRGEFLELYLLSALQRDLKVVGRFHYLDVVKGKPGYKKYLPPTLRRIRRGLEKLPELKPLIPLLAKHFEEMK